MAVQRVALSLHRPKTLPGMTRARNLAAAVRLQRLTAWDMAQYVKMFFRRLFLDMRKRFSLLVLPMNSVLTWNSSRTIGEMIQTGTTKVLGEKPAPLSTFPPHTSHGVAWNRSQGPAVGGQRLTPWTTARIWTFKVTYICIYMFLIRFLLHRKRRPSVSLRS